MVWKENPYRARLRLARYGFSFHTMYFCRIRSLTYYVTNNTRTKRNSYSPCSRPVRSGWHLSSTSHIDTSTTFCPLITQTLRIISVRCIPLSLRSKTRRRATLLLPTWICSCQSVGTVNFALPFTTNVTILISILQTFRSWVATSHLRPPMAFLSHNSSDTPGLAPLMNVLFWGRCDFPISFSGRDMSRNVWNRL